MSEIIKSNEEVVTMTSLEVVELINKFREEEQEFVVYKEHKTFMRDIRNEIEYLKKAGIKAENNFVPGSYIDKNNQERPCYKLNKAGIMQMLNKESALVRYKTQQYIEALEDRLKQPVKPLSTMELLKLQYKAIEEQDQKIYEVNRKVDEKFDDLPLFPSDSKILKRLVNQKVVPLLGGKMSQAYKVLSRKVFSDIYKQVHREFGVTGCEEIKRKDLELVKDIINKYELPMVLETNIKMINSQVTFAKD